MFSVGQNVVYGIHGVCKILGLEVRKVDSKNVEYFVLEPIRHPGSYYYIPTQNPNALAKLRELIAVDQFKALSKEAKYCWIDDENKRKQSYREMLSNMDCGQLISAIRVVNQRRSELLENGKKFHMCDENFLRDAERLVFEELSFVLDMDPVRIYDLLI